MKNIIKNISNIHYTGFLSKCIPLLNKQILLRANYIEKETKAQFPLLFQYAFIFIWFKLFYVILCIIYLSLWGIFFSLKSVGMILHGKDFLSKKCENHSMQTKRSQNLLQIRKAEHGNLVGSGDSAVQSSGNNPSSFPS